MTRPKLSLRRPLAMLGAALVGLTAAVAVAAPASAHHPVVAGTAICDPSTGEKVITWVVTHSETRKVATITGVKAEPDSAVDGVLGAVLSPAGKKGDTVTGTQRLPGTTTGKAKLTVTATWERHQGAETRTSEPVDLGASPCTQAPPPCVTLDEAKYKHTFDGTKGIATVELAGDKPLCAGAEQPFTLVSYFAPRPKFDVPQYVYGSPDTDAVSSSKNKVELAVELPDCNTQVDLIWGDKSKVIDEITEGGPRYGNLKLGAGGAPGNRSKGPQGWYNGGSKNCVTPAVEFAYECDGTALVHLSNNGELGKYPVEFTITGAGGFTKTVTVQPGKAEGGIAVPAEAAAAIKVTAEDKEWTGSWKRPETCALPTVGSRSDCDTYAVRVTNPAGNTSVTAEVAYAGKTEKVTVAGGKSETVTFPAGTDEAGTVTFADLGIEPRRVVFTKPADCAAKDEPDEGPILPVTGAAGTAIAGGAAVLLIAGVVLFVMARRRRIRFTA